MMFRFQRILVLAGMIGWISCEKNPDPSPQTDMETPEGGACLPSGRKIWVVNEGNFQGGNASLSVYDPVGKEAYSAVYQCVNQQPLGDVAQSVTVRNGSLYIVVNNSGKIEVVNRSTLEHQATITGLTSPRFMLEVSPRKAYVSDLYADGVWIIHTGNHTVTGKIDVAGWTEKMLLVNGKVWVANKTSDQMMVIHPQTDVLEDSIATGRSPDSFCLDATGKLWVLCSGGYLESIPELLRIDPVTRTVEARFTFSSVYESPGSLCINNTGDQLYWLNEGIYQMDISAETLPGFPLIPAAAHLFYGFNYDFVAHELYVTDAIDYSQRGWTFRYKDNGTLLDSFQTGVIPGYIHIE